ncbi:hypothetical protein ONS95_006533 [Cadophora gregata]|uniref:uncharacterized protein n=1 Tax=Cadophora gregata TaxID=51156 RepID=UPI0026DCE6E2|nr:uncharacterized protein ONS95_006533 [Cadophora gregata]KAK0101359.1 hypothetical protein ONS95_006533 [Cadophora gregata]
MNSKPPSAITKAWFRWKALRLPWRKTYLVGHDLQGNSFWEFHDALSTDKHRMRRKVQYPRSTHYSEIKISPQWHQWLRHTRRDPPSLIEQSQDLIRQRNLKILAAQADARWAAKPSFLDAPARSQPEPALEVKDPGGAGDVASRLGEQTNGAKREGESLDNTRNPDGVRHRFNEEPEQEESKKEDPWKNARGGPSEEWQPQAWTGNIAARR